MMMSKPSTTETTAASAEQEQQKKPAPLNREGAAEAVADLERRLADLSGGGGVEAPQQPPPAFAAAAPPPPAAAAAPAPAAAAAGGKNALLARIMAAQERAKQAQGGGGGGSGSGPPKVQPAEAPPPSFDLLDSNPAPPPPPAFDDTLLQQQQQQQQPPPPAFDSSLLPPASKPPPPAPSMMSFDPMAAPSPPPPPPQQQMAAMQAPSAPAFEDLMDTAAVPNEPQPMIMPPPVQPPQQQQSDNNSNALDDEALQAILGIEGLSDAEKREMIAEQMKIMQSIESNKKSTAVSAADAFESRSFSAAVQSIGQTVTNSSASGGGNMQMHGQERTREAIADGTAIKVQCAACENWMQVTATAQLMFCPVCQTVSPVRGSGISQQEAEQMAADARLAEQLQKEEYESAERATAAQQQQQRREKKSKAATPAKEQGWMEWLGFGTPAPAPAVAASTASAAHREIRTTGSTDSTEGLLSGGNVAKQQPLFACVTDSIGAAVNYATALPEDDEGNVHGVDASSLLAVTQVGRHPNGNNDDNNESNQRYERQQD